MKKVLLISAGAILSVGLSACATPAHSPQAAAVSAEKNAHSTYRKRGGHSKGAFVETYDLNGDGSVSDKEFYKARDQGFDVRDANRDNRVVADEYVAEYEGRLDQQLAERRDRQLKQGYVRFDVLDGDKDGVMTREEFKKSGKRMFDRLDTNGDGVVDESDTAKKY